MAIKQWFLKELRDELGLNQEQVGKATNFTQEEISAFERGAKTPNPAESKAIVDALVRRAAVRGLEILLLEKK
jgi:transcriptional regulator with XRE-family HTH domain